MREDPSTPDPLLSDLTPEQRAAVEHVDGPLIVVAGPGSGKTRVIARRVAYLVLRRGVPAWSVLAITFTNKAADEMRSRIDALLAGAGRPTVSTFHSFCARTLRRYAPIDRTADFSIYDEDDQRACVKKVIEEQELEEKQWKPGAVLARISDAKNKRIGVEAFDAHATSFSDRTIAKVYRRYEEMLREFNALDFDDLLLALLRVLEERAEVREELRARYRYILVDEYQDTNRPQYEIANLLSGVNGNLCVVGDPDQSIYKWRGADIRNILEFERDHPAAREVRLERNFRSTRRILAAAQGLIANNVERREKTLFTENEEGDAVQLVRCLSDAEEARLVADSIEARIREDDVPPREVAVFYRTNALSRRFEEELANRGIPHVVIGAVPFFARKEVKDVLSFVRLRANPQDDAALRRAVALAEGFGAKTLDRLVAFARERGAPVLDAIRGVEDVPDLGGRQRRAVLRFAELVDEVFALPEAPVGPMLRSVVERTGLKARLQKSEDPQDWARAENVEQLVNAGYELDERSGGADFRAFLDQVALLAGAPEDKEREDAVRLMTLHAAKGLEFDEVYIAGVDGGLLPLERDLEDCDREEERRLFYVGLTRARRRVTLTTAQVRRTWGLEKVHRPSSFLKEIPKDALESGGAAFAGEREGPRPVDLGRFRGGPGGGGAGTGSWGRRRGEDDDGFEGDAPHEDDEGAFDDEPWSGARRGGASAGRARAPAPWERPGAGAGLLAGGATEPQATRGDAEPIGVRDDLREGERVEHSVFGRGSVLRVEGSGVGRRVKVRFDAAGEKLLVLQYAKLTRA
jgi:DNA helicase-2/ATP-dependent DNA helicase PcrA